MAANFIQPGDTITLTAPYTVASGAGLLVGSIFAVALTAAASGATVEAKRTGVFDMAKVGSQAWSVGDLVYWDDTNKYLTKTASGNKLVGVAVKAVGSGSTLTTGRVLLTGQVS